MFKSVTGLGQGHSKTSAHHLRKLSLFLIAIFYLTLFLLSISTDLHAESLLYEHYPQKQVAPDTSYTEPFSISGLPSNAVLTNVEVQFDYIAYGVVQNYVSARVNKGSDPGSTGGASLVSLATLPDGNPGTYPTSSTYKSFTNWNGQGPNDSYYVRFATSSGCPYGGPTIKVVRLRITYTITQPDLAAERAYMASIGDPGQELISPKVGDQVYFSFEFLANDSSINNSFTIKCYLDGVLFYSTTYDSVQAGTRYYPSTQSASKSWTVTAGTHGIRWKVDADDQISESSESNNEASKSWNIADQFDLVAGIVSLRDGSGNLATGKIGDTVYFRFDYSIAGQGTTTPFDIKCELDGNSYWTQNNTQGTGGQDNNVTADTAYLVTAGSHTVTWTLDFNSELPESDEGNNSSSMGWTPQAVVIPPADPNWVKTYRLVWAGNGHQDHLYTTSLNEKESAEASGYIYDGEDFMVSSTPFTGGVEVARLRKDGPNYKIRLYTTGATEIQSAKNQGYVQEDSLGYVYAAAHTGATEIKRCYHAGITDRFYTAYQAEFTAALAQGYREENPLGYAPPGSGHAPEQPHATAPDSAPCVAIPPMLKASAFAHYDAGARHVATSWEVTKVQGDYGSSNLVLSRVDDTRNLTTITPDANVLTPQTRYWWRVRYKDANGRYSSWSPEAAFITRCYLATPRTLTVDGPALIQHNCRSHYQKYIFAAVAGQRYVVTLIPIQGDADLYGSFADADLTNLPNATGSAKVSKKSGTAPETILFQADHSGVFHVAGYGASDCDYRLSVTTSAKSVITPTRTSIPAGGTIQFDGRSSLPSAQGTSIASYLWTFSDGGSASGQVVSHTFNYSDQPQTAVLTVTDDAGHTDQSAISIIVTGTTQGTKANQSGHSSDPVNMATGNFTYSNTDLIVSGTGFPFAFARAYNSQDIYQAGGLPMGYGWTHSFNIKIIGDPQTQLTVIFPDGHGEIFTPDGNGGFKAQPGVHNKLIRSGDGRFKLTMKSLVSYLFNDDRMLAEIQDMNGNILRCIYAVNGTLTKVIDTVEREYNLAYDPVGHLTQVTDPIGRTLKYTYNGQGDLTSFTDPTGAVTGYVYDDQHQITTVVDPNGTVSVSMTYDELNRVVKSQSDAYGNAHIFTYDFQSHVTTQRDPLGNETTYSHDDRLRLISIKYPNGFAEYFTYDDQDNRVSVTNRRGYKTFYTYDERGNVTGKTDPLGQTIAITYDERNNPLTRTDALGGTTAYTYDDKGNPIKIKDALNFENTMTYDASGRLTGKKDANGNTTSYTYDVQGNVVDIQDALGNHTTYTYDGAGRLLSARDSAGNTTSYTYDGNNRLLTTTDPLGNVARSFYDRAGNRIKTIDPKGNTTLNDYDLKNRLARTTDPSSGMTTYVYNAMDQKIRISPPGNNATSFEYNAEGRLVSRIDPLGSRAVFAYDENGNLVYQEDRLGRVSRSTYDALDRLIASQDTIGNISRKEYDALGRITREIDPAGHANYYAYDALGRLLSVIDAAGNQTSYEYDAVGNLLQIIDSQGRRISMEYDAAKRLIRRINPMNHSEVLTYDSDGRLATHQDAKGNTRQLTYDAAGRLAKIRFSNGEETTFSYDANCNRTGMVDPQGAAQWTYDVMNRVISYTYNAKTISYTYDVNGNRNSITYPDGKTVRYSFNGLDRLDTVTDWLGRTTVYQYDPEEHLTKVKNPNGSLAYFETGPTGQLTSMRNVLPDGAVISSQAFTLDQRGNVLLESGASPLNQVKAPQEKAYAYDQANRLLTVGSTSYEYDDNGSLTKKVNGIAISDFAYDMASRLSEIKSADKTVQYLYDGLGNRIARIENGQRTNYILDLNSRMTQVLAETDADGNINKYHVYGLGLIETILPGGETQVYHFNSRGNTAAISNAAGQIVQKYAYDDFGTVNNQWGSIESSFKFLGRFGVMADGELYHIRARYYDPEIGRFITQDPLTGNQRDPQTLNRYVYALNNPIRFVDISGFSASSVKKEIESKQEPTDELHSNLVTAAKKLKSFFDDTNVKDAEKKKAFIDFMLSYGGTFASAGAEGIGADAIMVLFDNKYANITLNFKGLDSFFSSVGMVVDFFTFFEHYKGSYQQAKSGALDSLEDYTAEVTALAFNSAKDLSVSTISTMTKPIGWIFPSFNKDRAAFEEYLSTDVERQDILDFTNWILGN